MSRHSNLFRSLFDLSHNPFSKQAIEAPGIASPFYKGLYPGIERKMANAFLGATRPPPVALLSSMGEGVGPRGFGKTRYLLWFADEINRDLGRRSLALAGAHDVNSGALAVYASFDTIAPPSLSRLLFDVVRGALDAALHPAVTRDKHAVEAAATRLIANSQQAWSPWLLYWLSHGTSEQIARRLDDTEIFRAWHRARWGRELFRTLVAFVRALGVCRIVVLVDQVEDFARSGTPSYKLRRDIDRLSSLLVSDPVLHAHVTFVLTLHPASARVLTHYWPTMPTDHNVVVLNAPTLMGMIGMVKTYLDTARTQQGIDPLRPFTESSLRTVYALSGGRPGRCIPLLSTLLDSAAELNLTQIDAAAVAQLISNDEYSGGEDG